MKAGGRVLEDSYGQPKVMGRLSMSRSLGDLDLKRFGVVAIPDTRMVKVSSGITVYCIQFCTVATVKE